MKRPSEVSPSSFIDAIRNPELPVPTGLKINQGDIDKRYAIYRNNVTTSLIEALEVAFPIVQKLVGNEFFQAMAVIYVRRYPPESPLLMYYGENLPEFLKDFEPVKQLSYLSDIATLEVELRNAYHATDNNNFDPNEFETLNPFEVLNSKVVFADAVRLLASEFPIYSIWLANAQGGPKNFGSSEKLIITRPEFDPHIRKLTDGEYVFLKSLNDTNTIGEAAAKLDDVKGKESVNIESLVKYLIAEKAINRIVL